MYFSATTGPVTIYIECGFGPASYHHLDPRLREDDVYGKSLAESRKQQCRSEIIRFFLQSPAEHGSTTTTRHPRRMLSGIQRLK